MGNEEKDELRELNRRIDHLNDLTEAEMREESVDESLRKGVMEDFIDHSLGQR